MMASLGHRDLYSGNYQIVHQAQLYASWEVSLIQKKGLGPAGYLQNSLNHFLPEALHYLREIWFSSLFQSYHLASTSISHLQSPSNASAVDLLYCLLVFTSRLFKSSLIARLLEVEPLEPFWSSPSEWHSLCCLGSWTTVVGVEESQRQGLEEVFFYLTAFCSGLSPQILADGYHASFVQHFFDSKILVWHHCRPELIQAQKDPWLLHLHGTEECPTAFACSATISSVCQTMTL